MADPTYIMVLNDHTTFTDLDGCAIFRVPASEADNIEDALRNGAVRMVATFSAEGGRQGKPAIIFRSGDRKTLDED